MRKKCKKISSDENETNTRPAPAPLPRKNAGEREFSMRTRAGRHASAVGSHGRDAGGKPKRRTASANRPIRAYPFHILEKPARSPRFGLHPTSLCFRTNTDDGHRIGRTGTWTVRFRPTPLLFPTNIILHGQKPLLHKSIALRRFGPLFPQALPPNMPQRPGTSSTGRGNDLRNGTDEPPLSPKGMAILPWRSKKKSRLGLPVRRPRRQICQKICGKHLS